jgi:hypothetical protein
VEHPEEEVLRPDEAVVEEAGFLLGQHHHPAGAIRKPFEHGSIVHMPFTLAHVVAARPIWQAVGRRLPLSGIVVGSVAPDLEYLAHLDTERTIGHQLHGVFLLDVPVALVLLALWHGLIKRPGAALVSPSLRPPIDPSPFAFGPATRFAVVAASILTGIAGHLLWDGFTHRDGFITTRVGFLQEAIGRPHVYDLFNYASTLAGMVLLGWWWWRAVATRDPMTGAAPPPLPARARTATLTILVVLTATGGLANGLRLRLDGWGIETTVIGAVLGAMAAGLVTVTLLSLALRRFS